MDGQILDAVTEWETVPVEDGAAGLAELVDREFSGAVSDGVAWLFLLNGRGVGVADGVVDDFTDAELTARRAPDESLPLLFTMMNGDPETRAEYYSEDTPLSSAHETLASGGFTGFVELSENVLSGDYYVVYYGGRSLPVAFVGASRTLLTGDEAFERADDEVGIYRVREASVSVLDLPTPAEHEPSSADDGGSEDVTVATGSSAGGDSADVAGDGATTDSETDDGSVATDEPADDATESYGFDATAALGGDEESTAATDAPRAKKADDGAAPERAERDEAAEQDEDETASPDTANADADADAADDADGARADSAPEETDAEADPDAGEDPDPDRRTDRSDESDAAADAVTEGEPDATDAESASVDEQDSSVAESETETATRTGTDPRDESKETAADAATGTAGDDVSEVTFEDAADGSSSGGAAFEEEKQWRETQIIPPLSPDDEETSASAAESNTETTARSGSTTKANDDQRGSGSDLRERLREAETERKRAEERIESLTAERDELAAERDDLEAEREEAAAEAERLRERVDALESEVSELEAALERRGGGGEGGGDPAESMSAESALSGTSLFVRYRTKGGPTLEKAHDGGADREAVNENLRLEHHTTFESDSVTVDGEGFESFLHETTEYGFVRWLVEEFMYELQDTDNAGSMRELYDVLPDVDRVEFGGSVSLEYVEDGTEHREQRTFDVVGRDRLGNALVVADINATREATTEGELTSLVEGAEHLAETSDSLAAAFAVTASFFEPSALEVADEVTSSGLLGRSKNKSYVKLSRKRGFHLCLVESRHGQFHVNVPEL